MLNTLFLSISLAMDASCVSLASGINNTKRNITINALVFGIFQGLMPLLGLLLGLSVKAKIMDLIPLFSFIILLFLSVEAFNGISKSEEIVSGYKSLLLKAFATSIDAFSIGIVLLSYNTKEIIISIISFSLVTFIICFLVGMFAKKINGLKFSKLLSFIIFLGLSLSFLIKYLLL